MGTRKQEGGGKERRLSWAARRGLGSVGAVARLRWAGMPAEQLEPIAWELFRQKHGLEARAAVALAVAPPDALEHARGTLTPRHFLTLPYAALACLLLDPDTPPSLLDRVRADLASRPNLPPASDAEGWRLEVAFLVAELAERRARWDARHGAEVDARTARAEARKARLEARRPPQERIKRTLLRGLMQHYAKGTDPPPAMLEELAGKRPGQANRNP